MNLEFDLKMRVLPASKQAFQLQVVHLWIKFSCTLVVRSFEIVLYMYHSVEFIQNDAPVSRIKSRLLELF